MGELTSTPVPFIVGAPRSGTTLLRMMIDAHPSIAIPPETGFVPAAAALQNAPLEDPRGALLDLITDSAAWADFGLSRADLVEEFAGLRPFSIADGVRAFYSLYAARHGKQGFGDKTPGYVANMRAIEALLPEVAFIHIIRDGRDAALSLRSLWFSPGSEIETLASFWRDYVAAGRSAGPSCNKYYEVRFEALVSNPEQELRGVCKFLGLTYHPEMMLFYRGAGARLNEHQERRRPDGTLIVSRSDRHAQQWRTTTPPDPGRVGVWRECMSLDDQRRFRQVAGDLLRELGYPD